MDGGEVNAFGPTLRSICLQALLKQFGPGFSLLPQYLRGSASFLCPNVATGVGAQRQHMNRFIGRIFSYNPKQYIHCTLISSAIPLDK